MTRPGVWAALLVVGIWVLVAFLIDPRGEFPLNDDWTYAAAVKTLLEGGGLKFPGGFDANVIAQIFWGALFCLPFGFSFTALRVSTLALGAIGVLASYGILREVDADRKTALFGAFLLAFNPLYLVLSYTFMSDVPFVAVSVLSLYLLVRGMRRGSRLEIAAGLFLACVALLMRQTGLAIFVAFGLAYLAKAGLRLRSVLLACIPVALGVGVQSLWNVLTPFHSSIVARVFSPRSYASWLNAVMFPVGLIIVFVYLGLFLFPILLYVSRKRFLSRLRNFATPVFVVLAIGAICFVRMPILPNVFYDLGLGPATLRDAYILKLPSLPTAGKPFWLVVTLVAFVGAVVLVQGTWVAIAKAVKGVAVPMEKRVTLVMLLASALVYLGAFVIVLMVQGGFDRYVLFLVPLGAAIIILLIGGAGAGKVSSPTVPLALASLVLYGAFSIAGTHDYLAWNRARWEALNNLETEERVSADHIDGGYEFNGWCLRDPKYRATPAKSSWWVIRDDFMITFGPVPGFTELRRYPFRRWLPPGEGSILVLRRTTPDTVR